MDGRLTHPPLPLVADLGARVAPAWRQLHALPPEMAEAFCKEHAEQLAALLPLVGIAFGAGVLLLGFWDWVIAPERAGFAFIARAVMVLASAIAWCPNRLGLTPVQRWRWIYWTDAGALVLAATLLPGGLLHAMAGIAASLFAVSVATVRTRDFVLMQSGPTALFLATGTLDMSRTTFFGTGILYLFSLLLAFLVMLVVRALRQNAFLMEQKLRDVASHDGLTDACNHKYLHELAHREVAVARRKNRSLAVLMLDIDHFKAVNDTWGHATGDVVLRALADTCRANLREIDHFGRVGGEEFACVLPETGEADALLCAERLRQAVDALQVESGRRGKTLHFTISVGIAVLGPQHQDAEALLDDADQALYRAKDAGRNRVKLAARPAAEAIPTDLAGAAGDTGLPTPAGAAHGH